MLVTANADISVYEHYVDGLQSDAVLANNKKKILDLIKVSKCLAHYKIPEAMEEEIVPFSYCKILLFAKEIQCTA